MSQATKRKHVTQEVLSSYKLPENNERIVKVLGGRGNNLHEVFDPKEPEVSACYLVSMPTKFRKNVWIKRGDFVLVSPIEEGDKVKGEIIQILVDKHHLKFIKDQGAWPFPDCEEKKEMQPKDDLTEGDSSNDEDIFINTNRPMVNYVTDSDSSGKES